MTDPPKPLLIYGVNGDGLGHAARALVLTPYLRCHYRLAFHSSQGALALLREFYSEQNDISFVQIPGTRWIYHKQHISPWRSALFFLAQAFWVFPRQARQLCRRWLDSPPVGVISDFEPVVARAAALAGLPLVALSHQHAMSVMDPAGLGLLPLQQWIYRLYASLNIPRFEALVISSFFQLPLRTDSSKILVVGGLLRPEILRLTQAPQRTAGEVLVYLRRSSSYMPVLHALGALTPGAVVFGIDRPDGPALSALRFHPVDTDAFLRCLAVAPFVVAAAGHQLLCEALELQKPVLAIYERDHDEQRLNACMWEKAGYGMAVELERFEARMLQKFLNQLPLYRSALKTRIGSLGNAPHAARWICGQLEALSGGGRR